jgi:hypothetical protein
MSQNKDTDKTRELEQRRQARSRKADIAERTLQHPHRMRRRVCLR